LSNCKEFVVAAAKKKKTVKKRSAKKGSQAAAHARRQGIGAEKARGKKAARG